MSPYDIAYDIAFSSESGEKYAQIKYCLQAETVQTVLNKYNGRFWYEMTTGDGRFQWRKHFYYYGLVIWPEAVV